MKRNKERGRREDSNISSDYSLPREYQRMVSMECIYTRCTTNFSTSSAMIKKICVHMSVDNVLTLRTTYIEKDPSTELDLIKLFFEELQKGTKGIPAIIATWFELSICCVMYFMLLYFMYFVIWKRDDLLKSHHAEVNKFTFFGDYCSVFSNTSSKKSKC